MIRFGKYFATFVAVSSLLISSVSAEKIFNGNLSDSEKKTLESGKTVIKNTPSYKKTCIDSDSPAAQRLLDEVRKLKPAYIAEIIQTYDYEGNEDFLDKFESLIMDIPSYVGIPYYSERVGKYYDLYEAAEILSSSKNEQNAVVKANLTMEPFDLIKTEINTTKESDYFYYESTNLSKLRYYDKFDCVYPKNMKSIIIVFRSEDKWILYAVGAVKAPDIFFLRDRIDVSFMNRIKTFCSYFFDKL